MTVADPLIAFYGLAAFVSVGNLALMHRPKAASAEDPEITFCIPARNEAENLRELLPQLLPQGRVIVFDDESDDRTGEIAEALGARVIRPVESLPKGWTGKNRACHELGMAAETDYFCFLDADVRVSPDFAARLRTMAHPRSVGTAFPTIIHGEFPEPIVLGWVGWSLLALNPFFLVRLSSRGHNRFTNGQIALWPRELYRELRPNEALRGAILEDVMIGRLLARNGIPVDVANLASSMRVAMYRTWRQALDGMSKNSYEITGSAWGNALLSLLLFVLGWGWLLMSPGLLLWGVGLLFLSAVATTVTCGGNVLYALTFPVSLTVGAYTLLRSWWWRRTGRTTWKGRVYSG